MDIILIIVILLIVFFAGLYVYRAKKKGRTCIGCPNSDSCGGACSCDKNKENNK